MECLCNEVLVQLGARAIEGLCNECSCNGVLVQWSACAVGCSNNGRVGILSQRWNWNLFILVTCHNSLLHISISI